MVKRGSGALLRAATVRLALALIATPAMAASVPPERPGAVHRRGLVSPVAVFGTDDRTAVPQRLQWIAERVGLLFNNQTRTVCTAFCVADNVIATAAHCVGRGQQPDAIRFGDFMFARNYDRVRQLTKIEGAASGAAAQHVLTGDFRLKIRPPIDAANDWALVRLPRNACPAKSLETRPLGAQEIMAEAKTGRVFQISYHRDFALWRPALSKPCAVSRDHDVAKWTAIAPDFISPEQMILHTCDTGGASSGSPILLETDDGPVVIGVNVGTYVQSRVVIKKGQTQARQQTETVANTAVNASAFAHHVETLRSAEILSTRPAIRDLQERLKGQSLYSSRVDGSYGPALKAAIEAYEQARSLPVTGLPTQTLVQRLLLDGQRSGHISPTSTKEKPPRN